MKASLVGFIKCNGLNGLSESHLFITQVNLKFQVVISFVSSCWGCLLGLNAGEYKRKQDTCACQLTKPLFKKKKKTHKTEGALVLSQRVQVKKSASETR